MSGFRPRTLTDEVVDQKFRMAGELPYNDVLKVLARSEVQDGKLKSHCVWTRAIPPPAPPDVLLAAAAPDDAERLRWTYADLDQLLSSPRLRPEQLRLALKEDNAVTRTTAAIALSRLGHDAGLQQLAGGASTPTLPMPLRCAAVEALARLDHPQVVPTLRELLRQYGRTPWETKSSPSYLPDLHAELLRGLARYVEPADDREFASALRSPSADVQIEALRAWTQTRRASLPVEATDLLSGGEPKVRIAAIQAVAARRPPDALQRLTSAQRDPDLQVRVAAIAALAGFDDAESLAALHALIKPQQPERIRAVATAALARRGDRAAVAEAAADPAWRVRQQTARGLRYFPDRHGETLARRLLDDTSGEVTRSVILGVESWPLSQSGPVLLAAMEKPSLQLRKAAAAQLARQWPPAAIFPPEAPAERRTTVLRQLEAQLTPSVAAAANTRENADRAALPGPDEVERLARLIAAGDTAAMQAFGPTLVSALEVLAFERHATLPDNVWREVLPPREEAFEALRELESGDMQARRRAADRLTEIARRKPLRPLAVHRLAEIGPAEADPLVWRSMLMAIAGDGCEPAIRLAYAAVGHAAAEVRRRACEHLAASPLPAHVPVLLPVLDDPSQAVVSAALRALAATRQVSNTAAIRKLLASPNEQVAIDAAIALCRLGDAAGPPALQRAAYSRDPQMQRQAAVAMGELADKQFTGVLMQLLAGQPSVQRAALDALPKVAGVDVAADDAGSTANTPDRVRRWQRWHAGTP